MQATIFADPCRPGTCDDGEVLRAAQLNGGDGLCHRVSFDGDGDAVPSGARIDGMIEASARTACPNIISVRSNGLELDAPSDFDGLESFRSINGALHFAIG